MKLKIKLNECAKMPSYAHEGDAGMDVYSSENKIILPGKRETICTGIFSEFDSSYVALVWDKSGLASKSGIKTMAGVIDASYRGEWKIVLLNTSDKEYEVKKGEKICQILFQKIERAEIEFSNLSNSERGETGFGASGTN